MTAREDARRELAARAWELYKTPMTVKDVAEQLGCSYGKAHSLITLAGGKDAFRRRGTRPSPDGHAPSGPLEDEEDDL